MRTLELNGLQELNQEELANIDGGGGIWDKITQKAIKFTWTGFGDGDPSNDEVDLYIFGIKVL